MSFGIYLGDKDHIVSCFRRQRSHRGHVSVNSVVLIPITQPQWGRGGAAYPEFVFSPQKSNKLY